jgi:dATP pyrophosphohydrolase
VPTPGSRDRGPRRIVAGVGRDGDVATSGEYYYTGDHYRSFAGYVSRHDRERIADPAKGFRQAGIFPLPAIGHAAVRAAPKARASLVSRSISLLRGDRRRPSQLGEDLAFPAWYGHNLDALNDCLTDFSWREAAGYLLLIATASDCRSNVRRPGAVNEVFAAAIDEWRTARHPAVGVLRGRQSIDKASGRDMRSYKHPVSVLVVIHTADLEVLLLERAAHPGYWQSVTGSQETGEQLRATAAREVAEETGIRVSATALCDWQLSHCYEIFAEWRHRYAPGVRYNTEHVFSLQLPAARPVSLAPGEHRNYCYMTQALAFPMISAVGNIDAYIQAAKQFPILTEEEEFRLATRFARKRMSKRRATGSFPPASGHSIARGYLGYGLPHADLIQEGNIGLMKAVKRFDPGRMACAWCRSPSTGSRPRFTSTC